MDETIYVFSVEVVLQAKDRGDAEQKASEAALAIKQFVNGTVEAHPGSPIDMAEGNPLTLAAREVLRERANEHA